MKIAICDDEKTQIQYLAALVKAWAAHSGRLANVETFDSAEAFRFAWCEDRSYDVLLLDIQMSGQNGMELSKEIRRTDKRIAIIFITGFSEYIGQGYEVDALHYLLKPVDENKLFECLDKACERTEGGEKSLLLECGEGRIRLRQDEILFFEACAHCVSVTVASQIYEARESLGEIRRRLDPNQFIRPHRCYIVGLKYIRKITRTELTLDNGANIPLSRRLYHEVNRAFIRFYGGGEE